MLCQVFSALSIDQNHLFSLPIFMLRNHSAQELMLLFFLMMYLLNTFISKAEFFEFRKSFDSLIVSYTAFDIFVHVFLVHWDFIILFF
jgi:hypothetical protein